MHYYPCILNEPPARAEQVQQADLMTLLEQKYPDLRGWKIHLCGDPAFVNKQRKACYLAGASLPDIHADAFVPG
jgi:NAD(P)H-flavin reductase